MLAPDERRLLAAAAVLLLVGGAWWLLGHARDARRAAAVAAALPRSDPAAQEEQATPAPDSEEAATEPATEATRRLVVHVAGAVAAAGVYRLPEGARVVDALEAAGGAREEAAPHVLNLARRLADGDRVYVPTGREVREGWTAGAATGETGDAGAKVDVNRARPQRLEALPGIGPVLAARIVAYRREHGPFRRAEDLLGVSGIGPRVLERIRPRLTLP